MTELTVDTAELRKIISEAVADLPSRDEVDARIDALLTTRLAEYPRRKEMKTLVKNEVAAAFTPFMEEFRQGFQDLKTMVAVLVEQNKAHTQTMERLETTQARLDVEHNEHVKVIAQRGERLTALESDVKEFRTDVFGSPDRPGTSSLLDQLRLFINETSQRAEDQHTAVMNKLQVNLDGTAALAADLSMVKTRLDEHHAFIEARRKLERLVVQSVPKAGRVIADNITDRVKWSAAIGTATIVITYLAKILGMV
jgi:chromosome segregation ATPase